MFYSAADQERLDRLESGEDLHDYTQGFSDGKSGLPSSPPDRPVLPSLMRGDGGKAYVNAIQSPYSRYRFACIRAYESGYSAGCSKRAEADADEARRVWNESHPQQKENRSVE